MELLHQGVGAAGCGGQGTVTHVSPILCGDASSARSGPDRQSCRLGGRDRLPAKRPQQSAGGHEPRGALAAARPHPGAEGAEGRGPGLFSPSGVTWIRGALGHGARAAHHVALPSETARIPHGQTARGRAASFHSLVTGGSASPQAGGLHMGTRQPMPRLPGSWLNFAPCLVLPGGFAETTKVPHFSWERASRGKDPGRGPGQAWRPPPSAPHS